MKNIYILPTEKPSRLHLIEDTLTITSEYENSVCDAEVNIYITSYEEIKEVDWFLRKNKIHQLRWDDGNGHLYTKNGLKIFKSSSKKIILTTDTDLIADGVQAIGNDFLEWFVQNPSCVWVELGFMSNITSNGSIRQYKIIIPKEPKQEMPIVNGSYGCTIRTKRRETLEEAAHKMLVDYGIKSMGQSIGVLTVKKLMVDMAQWQAERMHSEVIEFAEWCDDMGYTQVANSFWKSLNDEKGKTTKELFEQFKKK
jgi:hypothetical protein